MKNNKERKFKKLKLRLVLRLQNAFLSVKSYPQSANYAQ